MMREGAAAFAGLTTSDGRRPRVAIVGGTRSAVLVATMLAEQFGCAPLAAPDADAMMGLFGEDAGVDLVLADVSGTGTQGLVLVELARALGQSRMLPVLALVEGRAPQRAGDFAGIVSKPYSPRELFCAMRDCLTRMPERSGIGHA